MATNSATKPRKPLLSKERLLTHLVLAIGTVVGYLLALIYDPSDVIAEPLSLALGYVALVYLVAGLIIGPLYLARQRRNPVNLYLRRDVGIWAGITALLHVFFSFQVFAQGQALLYFFQQVQDPYLPLLDLFGLSNYVGLIAAVIVLVLLVLSNDRSLRRLKGKRWKRIQQWSYPLIVLTILHTLGYQLYNERDWWFFGSLIALTAMVCLFQGAGVLVHRRRERQRAIAPARTRPAGNPLVTPGVTQPLLNAQSVSPIVSGTLSRRRFIVLAGTALVAGIAATVSLKGARELLRPTEGDAVPSEPPAGATPATSELVAPSPTVPIISDNVAPPTPTTTQADTPVGADPAPTKPAAPAPTSTVPAPSNGLVLTTLDACPANSAVTFTTPDTGETAILIHEADGTVQAFSNVCTHRPYPVVYDVGSQLLVCPLHRACFNAKNGAVTRGPARRTLPSIQVHVDGQGNVIYG